MTLVANAKLAALGSASMWPIHPVVPSTSSLPSTSIITATTDSDLYSDTDSPLTIPSSPERVPRSRFPLLLEPATSTFDSIPPTSQTSDVSGGSGPGTSGGGGSGGGGGGGGGIGGSEAYFFGFLITFIALLVVFLGCGCVSRRRFVQQRRTIAELRAGSRDSTRELDSIQPTSYEPWLATDEKDTSWNWQTIKPLSAVVVRQDQGNGLPSIVSDNSRLGMPSPSPLPPPPPPASPSTPAVFSLGSLFSGYRHPRNEIPLKAPTNKGKASTEEDIEKPPDLVQVQVAVIVAMPSNPDQRNNLTRGEYEFGVAEVPCIGPPPSEGQ